MDFIDRRVIDEAMYLIENKTTVRQTAKVFGVSKSTVHKDISERLCILDDDLYKKARDVLEKNLLERHIRGGEATKAKFEKSK